MSSTLIVSTDKNFENYLGMTSEFLLRKRFIFAGMLDRGEILVTWGAISHIFSTFRFNLFIIQESKADLEIIVMKEGKLIHNSITRFSFYLLGSVFGIDLERGLYVANDITHKLLLHMILRKNFEPLPEASPFAPKGDYSFVPEDFFPPENRGVIEITDNNFFTNHHDTCDRTLRFETYELGKSVYAYVHENELVIAEIETLGNHLPLYINLSDIHHYDNWRIFINYRGNIVRYRKRANDFLHVK